MPKPHQRKRIKAYALVNIYDGKLIAYGFREKEYTYAVLAKKSMAHKLNNKMEEVAYKVIPCEITYSLPTKPKKS